MVVQFDKLARKEYHVFTDKFLNFQDAVTFTERLLDEYHSDDFVVVEHRIVFLAGMYTAGISFTPRQGALDI